MMRHAPGVVVGYAGSAVAAVALVQVSGVDPHATPQRRVATILLLAPSVLVGGCLASRR